MIQHANAQLEQSFRSLPTPPLDHLDHAQCFRSSMQSFPQDPHTDPAHHFHTLTESEGDRSNSVQLGTQPPVV